MGRGYVGLFNGTFGDKINKRKRQIVTINETKQLRHIAGDKFLEGRSVFYGTISDAQLLVDKHSGTGMIINHGPKERIDFSYVIGEYFSLQKGTYEPTTVGIIHYSKTGCHIVPSNPNRGGKY